MKKKAIQSLAVQTKMVLPSDTNPLNTLFGGRLLAWMDEIASISAHRHCGRVVVTASINNVSFDKPIIAGEIVTLEAKVSRAFTSSMEVFVDVYVEQSNGKREKCNEAIYVFVAIDQNRNPIDVPALIPESLEEKDLDAHEITKIIYKKISKNLITYAELTVEASLDEMIARKLIKRKFVDNKYIYSIRK